MDIVAAYEQMGTYRGAAALCGTTHKTVKRVIERRLTGETFDAARRELPKNTDAVTTVIAEKVRATNGRISAKRLLPLARAAGYTGSARNFRPAVAEAKRDWRRRRRVYRLWQPTSVEHLVIDWTTEGGWQVFCAVLPWSRWRFVRLATDQKALPEVGTFVGTSGDIEMAIDSGMRVPVGLCEHTLDRACLVAAATGRSPLKEQVVQLQEGEQLSLV